MKQSCLLFDLDGTLTDPKVGITCAAATALRAQGIEAQPDALTFFIGPPLIDSFCQYCHMTEEQALRAVEDFRVYFDRQGWLENIPYPGIGALLQTLRAAGKTLLVATSKPEYFALRILEHFDLAQYFSVICGAPMDEASGARKDLVIRNALARGGIADPAEAIMIGDRSYDIKGAHALGMPAVGVLYGYGSRAELTESGADYLAENLSELQQLLLGQDE